MGDVGRAVSVGHDSRRQEGLTGTQCPVAAVNAGIFPGTPQP
jgi:hypothetical protein